MSIDWTSFTPLTALLGGGLIGLAAGLFILLHGQIMGASGILGRFLAASYDRQERSGWDGRLVFLLGVMVGQAAYATSKGAVNAFTRNAAIDLGRFGVRVNAVAPGPVDGGMWDAAFEAGLDCQTVMDSMKHLIPLEGRWSSEQDIADAVAWLASDKAAMVTGQIIGVDGGILA